MMAVAMNATMTLGTETSVAFVACARGSGTHARTGTFMARRVKAIVGAIDAPAGDLGRCSLPLVAQAAFA
jgi:hypothetical protein